MILPPQCIAVSGALDQLESDATVLALSACYSKGVKEALGDYPTWAYTSGFVLPGVDDPDPGVQAQLDAYNEWFETQDYELEAVIPLQTALAVQRHLIAAGGADAIRESFIEAASPWTGPVFLGVPDVGYGSVTTPFPLPALSSLARRRRLRRPDRWRVDRLSRHRDHDGSAPAGADPRSLGEHAPWSRFSSLSSSGLPRGHSSPVSGLLGVDALFRH